MGKSGVVAEFADLCDQLCYESLEIEQGIITGTADIGRREEGEYVFGRLWQFPELTIISIIYVSCANGGTRTPRQ